MELAADTGARTDGGETLLQMSLRGGHLTLGQAAGTVPAVFVLILLVLIVTLVAKTLQRRRRRQTQLEARHLVDDWMERMLLVRLMVEELEEREKDAAAHAKVRIRPAFSFSHPR